MDGWIDGCIFCLFTSLVLLDGGGWMLCLFTSRLRLCRCGRCERLGLNWSNVQCVDICLFGLLVVVVCCFTSSCHHSSLTYHLKDRLPETHRQCCSNKVQQPLIHSATFALPLLIFLSFQILYVLYLEREANTCK
jgi:hypothetical protein